MRCITRVGGPSRVFAVVGHWDERRVILGDDQWISLPGLAEIGSAADDAAALGTGHDRPQRVDRIPTHAEEATMIRTGDTLHNPVTGELIRFVETAADTGGEYVQDRGRRGAERSSSQRPTCTRTRRRPSRSSRAK